MQPTDLMPARDILKRFPELQRWQFYEMVKRGKVTAYPLPPAPWRDKPLNEYSLGEVAAALGLTG